MSKLDQPRLNLLKLIEEHQTDLANVSLAIKRNHAYLHQYINRGSPRQLGENERNELARLFGVSPDVFRAEASNITVAGTGDRLEKRKIQSRQIDIPEFDVAAAVGQGDLSTEADENEKLKATDHWLLPRRYLAAFSEKPEALAIIKVAGDSMDPEYKAGERVLIDRSHILPSPPGIYLIWDGLGLVLKRIEVIVGSSDPLMLRISCINHAYSTYECALPEININGRVVGKWLWK